jgi:hypothetical protein
MTFMLTEINDQTTFSVKICRSHDGFVVNKDGILEPSPGSSYASQQTVFDDLGKGVLKNAFEGKI